MNPRLIIFYCGSEPPVFKKIDTKRKLEQLQTIIKADTISLLPLPADLIKKGYAFYADDEGLLKKGVGPMNPMVYPLIQSELPYGLKGIAVLVCPKKYKIQDLSDYYHKISLGMEKKFKTVFEKMSKIIILAAALEIVAEEKKEKPPSKADQKKNKIRLRYPTKKKRATRIGVLEARLRKTRNYASEISLIQEMDA